MTAMTVTLTVIKLVSVLETLNMFITHYEQCEEVDSCNPTPPPVILNVYGEAVSLSESL